MRDRLHRPVPEVRPEVFDAGGGQDAVPFAPEDEDGALDVAEHVEADPGNVRAHLGDELLHRRRCPMSAEVAGKEPAEPRGR